MKFNMLMCWCIGKAASRYQGILYAACRRQLMQYDAIAVNTIVRNKDNEVEFVSMCRFLMICKLFNEDYLKLDGSSPKLCQNHIDRKHGNRDFPHWPDMKLSGCVQRYLQQSVL